jgi:hypothetical protein
MFEINEIKRNSKVKREQKQKLSIEQKSFVLLIQFENKFKQIST